MFESWMKENDIKLDEEFKNHYSDKIYRIHKFGLELFIQEKDDEDEWRYSKMSANVLEASKVKKLPWRPNKGDGYYVPNINPESVKYSLYEWENSIKDNTLYNLGLVCKTEEEAKQKYSEIIKFCKKEFV